MADKHADPTISAKEGGDGRTPSRGSIVNFTDLWVAIVILAGVALLWYHTTQWEVFAALIERSLAPSLFPRIWLGLIAFMALFVPFEQYLQGEQGKALDKDRSKPVKPVTYATMLLMVPICGSMPWLGSIMVIVLICVILPLIWGERRLYILVPYAILFPPAIIFLFKTAFKVNFEPGVLGLGFK